MAMASRDNMIIHQLVILLLSICLQASSLDINLKAKISLKNHVRPKVTIQQGSIRGVNLLTKNNRSVAGFLGIPFAEPPLGYLRFRPPAPAKAWNKTLDASSDTPDCPQLSLSGTEILGNEDCLYTNVYTPKLPKKKDAKLLPVMMYIYGGGYRLGGNNSTLYGPGYLLDQDVVLVVPSYRLGALGFLSTGDAVAPGNWGLKDLAFALQWIRDNIAYFGGDPNRVTILGNSAGSMAVNYLTLSNLTTGLIHRYITQSGSGLSTTGYQPAVAAAKNSFKLGKYVGCETTTSAILVECLRSANIMDILKATQHFLVWETFPAVLWEPTVEPDLEEAILTDTTANLLASGKIDNLPGIVGALPGDGFVLTGYFDAYPDKFEEFLTIFDDVLPYALNYYNKVNNVSAYTNALKSYYFNDDLTSDRTTLLANLTQLCSDFIGNFPNREELELITASNSTYLYSFEYRGTFSYSYIWAFGLTKDVGVSHSDELIYLFPQSETLFGALNKTMSNTDLKMVDTMVQLWTSFAKNGAPKSTARNEAWPPYSRNMEHLRIGNRVDISVKVEAESAAFENRMKFLKNLNAIYM